VPRVVGLSLLRAETKILRAKCRIGKVTRTVSSRKKKGRVLAQRPKAGTVLTFRGRVRLIVGRGRRR
jgi:beta-lactam-binding protein with PASTA domain